MNTTLTQPRDSVPRPGAYGVYPDVPFEDYLKWPLMSQSVLKQGRASMAHLKAALDGQSEIEPTDSMILGSALDTAFLEPELMPAKVVVWTNGARRGKEWEAFKSENAGKSILTVNAYEKLQGMVRSLRKHPEVKKWWGQFEDVQCSMVGELFDIPFKVRLDARTPDPLFDLKMSNDADARQFAKTVFNLGYHIQSFSYCKIAERRRMIMLVVEDEFPFDIVPYEMDDWMEIGERETRQLIDDYKRCRDTGIWPGRASKPVRLPVPAWLQQDEETTNNRKVQIT